MKTKIIIGILLFISPFMRAMEKQQHYLHSLAIKLTTHKNTSGKIVEIPDDTEKAECTIGSFDFSITQEGEFKDKTAQVLISTHDTHKTFIDSFQCPLLPHATSRVTFVHDGEFYEASATPLFLMRH